MKKTRRIPCFLIGTLIFSYTLNAQTIINTIIGTVTGYSGDGGPGALAKLNGSTSIIYDTSGNIYIADAGNNCIRKVNTSGIITTIAGTGIAGFSGDGGPATAAQFDGPVSLALDASGNLYVADRNNNRVRKINATGTISTYAGNGAPMFNGDGGKADTSTVFLPSGICFDNSGNLLIADYGHYKVRSINSAGIITTIAGVSWAGYNGDGGPATSAELTCPVNVFVDANSNIYVADCGNSTIRKINTAGNISTLAGIGYTSGYSGDGLAATSAKINYPYGMAIDSSNNFYFTDILTHSLRKINSAGIITTEAGNGTAGFAGDGGPSNLALFNQPAGVRISPSGNILIADALNSRIRLISTTTGIKENEMDDRISIYPNPAFDFLYIKDRKEEKLNFELKDVTGKQILQDSFTSEFRMEVSQLSAGTYFLKVFNENGAKIKKILIQH